MRTPSRRGSPLRSSDSGRCRNPLRVRLPCGPTAPRKTRRFIPAESTRTEGSITFLVPFDGAELSTAALVRATEFGAVLDESVLALTVIRDGNVVYARSRGWVGPEEAFTVDSVVSTLQREVTEISPSAEYRHELVSRYAPSGTIAKRIKKVAREVDASLVFVGSATAGRLVTVISSVGGTMASTSDYAVVIIRQRRPPKIHKIKANSPYTDSNSDG